MNMSCPEITTFVRVFHKDTFCVSLFQDKTNFNISLQLFDLIRINRGLRGKKKKDLTNFLVKSYMVGDEGFEPPTPSV